MIIRRLWNKLGAKVVSMPAQEHDRILAFVSHLPHAIAFSLVNSVSAGFLKFAAGGFKDTTRIASSDSRIWTDVFLSNRENILMSIAGFRKNLSALEKALKSKDTAALSRLLKSAARKRNSLL